MAKEGEPGPILKISMCEKYGEEMEKGKDWKKDNHKWKL